MFFGGLDMNVDNIDTLERTVRQGLPVPGVFPLYEIALDELVSRLKQAEAGLAEITSTHMHVWIERAKQAEAENERLRDALREIARAAYEMRRDSNE
jgi:hypothetical protein